MIIKSLEPLCGKISYFYIPSLQCNAKQADRLVSTKLSVCSCLLPYKVSCDLLQTYKKRGTYTSFDKGHRLKRKRNYNASRKRQFRKLQQQMQKEDEGYSSPPVDRVKEDDSKADKRTQCALKICLCTFFIPQLHMPECDAHIRRSNKQVFLCCKCKKA